MVSNEEFLVSWAKSVIKRKIIRLLYIFIKLDEIEDLESIFEGAKNTRNEGFELGF